MLAGKSALVTGSTSGIGLAIARALAAEGANVMLHGLGDADAIRRLCEEFEADYDVEVAFSGADVRFPAAIESLARDAVSRLASLQNRY